MVSQANEQEERVGELAAWNVSGVALVCVCGGEGRMDVCCCCWSCCCSRMFVVLLCSSSGGCFVLLTCRLICCCRPAEKQSEFW